MGVATPYHLLVVIPVFNDWECINGVLPRLDAAMAAYEDVRAVSVLLVDDSSTTAPEIDFPVSDAKAISKVSILRLKRNLGHQRAIGIGLTYAHAKLECDAVVVMDGDGEDRPEDVPRLLDGLREHQHKAIVFAERERRSESLLFKVFYHLYRLIHVVLTGIAVRVGNFSAIPARYLENFAVISETWNHYAAAVFTTSLPRAQVPIARGERIAGEPRMRFTSLVQHGLSALAVHGAIIGVRLLIGFSGAFAGMFLWMLLLLMTDNRWAWLTVFLSSVLFVCTLIVFGLNLIILNNRSQLGFLPGRDYEYFVDRVYDLDGG